MLCRTTIVEPPLRLNSWLSHHIWKEKDPDYKFSRLYLEKPYGKAGSIKGIESRRSWDLASEAAAVATFN